METGTSHPTCGHRYAIDESRKEITVWCYMPGEGLRWEFHIGQRDVEVPLKGSATTLRLDMSTASWEAFTDTPKLFEELSVEVPDTLKGVQALLDRLEFERR
jgi:hypothetical protein